MGKTDGVGLIHCNADVSCNLNHGLQICITLLDRNLQRICFFFIHKELRSRQIRAWRYLFHIFHMPFFAANTWQGSCYLTTMWSRREVRNYKTHFSLSADVGHRSIYLKIDRFLVQRHVMTNATPLTSKKEKRAHDASLHLLLVSFVYFHTNNKYIMGFSRGIAVTERTKRTMLTGH